jgi:hypothetical protein
MGRKIIFYPIQNQPIFLKKDIFKNYDGEWDQKENITLFKIEKDIVKYLFDILNNNG